MPWRELSDENAHWQFLRTAPWRPGLFLQSPAWAAVQRQIRVEVSVCGYEKGGTLLAVAVCVKQRLPFGKHYWLVPKGPLVAQGVSQADERIMIRELKDLLSQGQTVFLRLEPASPAPEAKRTYDVNPRATAVCDLTRTEEQLLTAMHQKTRYNIRLAEKHGLKFRWGGAEELEVFWQLLKQTSGREGFRIHPREHYAALLRAAAPDFAVRPGLVEFNGEVLAASLAVVCQSTATYLHGASSRSHKELMAPYLLHWSAMAELKASGVTKYDFWGAQPLDGSLSAWTGFSRFKLGFGGERREDPGTFDIVARPAAYAAYSLARAARRWLGKTTGL